MDSMSHRTLLVVIQGKMPGDNLGHSWDHENYLVISGFSLYQGKKTEEIMKSWDSQYDYY